MKNQQSARMHPARLLTITSIVGFMVLGFFAFQLIGCEKNDADNKNTRAKTIPGRIERLTYNTISGPCDSDIRIKPDQLLTMNLD